MFPMGILAPAGILEGWEKIADITLTAATTSITINSLDLAADKAYEMLISQKQVVNTGDISLYYNNDQVSANYYGQYLSAVGAAIAAGAYNSAVIYFVDTNYCTFVYVKIMRDPDGRPRCISRSAPNRATATGIYIDDRTHRWTSTANVTRIDLVNSRVNGFAIGTNVLLFKVRS